MKKLRNLLGPDSKLPFEKQEQHMKKTSIERTAVGIDLGTCYSCVGVFRGGRVEIIVNDKGNKKTPSCVAFSEGACLVGEAAINQKDVNPTNTIFDVKSLTGRRCDDPSVVYGMNHWPFSVIAHDGKPVIQVEYKGGNRTFSPEEISTMVLKRMKYMTETYLVTGVTDAVITVPVYFNQSQRQATRKAAAAAGLNVLRILNEPVAAAVAYGFHRRPSGERNVLIFDLGSAALQLCVLTIEDGIMEVKSVDSDMRLGGMDLDDRMVNHFAQEFQKRYGKDLMTNKTALHKLRTACERAKRTLSSSTSAKIEIGSLFEGTEFNPTITREEFEHLNANLFSDILQVVEKALSNARLNKTDIHDVVLVGGSTLIPKIQDLLRNFFNRRDLGKQLWKPDEVVAYGAAVQAAILAHDKSKELKELLLLDATSSSLGIETADGNIVFVIKKNETYPTRQSKTFSTHCNNQSCVLIQVYEGESKVAKDNNLLGKFEFSGIPSALRGVPQIQITFDIDANGLVTVCAFDESTGREYKVPITGGNYLDNNLVPSSSNALILHSGAPKPQTK